MKDINDIDRILKDFSRITKKWGLKYTFKSLDYILNIERVSLLQCAEGKFPTFEKTKIEADYEPMTAVKILLLAGNINNIGYDDFEKLENRVFEQMEEWRKKVGDISLLHVYLVSVIRNEHFFSGALPIGQKIEQVLKNVK